MFYSTQILSKKGALGTIWVASHLEKRLKRSQIFETSIPASVDSIINPEAPLALRLSGQLLLGIVRVYLRKLEYLSKDAQSAVDSLNKSATQGTNVDLEGEGRAAYGAITLEDAPGEVGGGALADDAFMFQGSASGALTGSRGAGLGGGSGFQVPGFSPGGDSLAPVEDVSDWLGSQWGIDDEKFEASGEDVNRRFSIELERLRAEAVAPPPGPGDLFFQAPEEEGDLMPVPDDALAEAAGGDELFAVGGATPTKTPASRGAAPLPGTSDIRITPQSLGLDMLPEVGGPAFSAGGTPGGTFGGLSLEDAATPASAARGQLQGGERDAAGEAGEAGAATAQQRRRQQQQRRKKKAAQVDVDAHGRPATSLSVQEIRSLLNDRAPLLTKRGMGQRKEVAGLATERSEAVPKGEEARHSWLFRPATFTTLPPELLGLYNRALGIAPGGPLAGLTSPRQKRLQQQQQPAAPEAPPEAAGADAAGAGAPVDGPPAEEAGAAEGAALLSGTASAGFSAGRFDLGAGPSEVTFDEGDIPLPMGPEEDWIEPPDTQQGAGFPAALEGGAQEAVRRGSLVGLELVPLGELEEEAAAERSEGAPDSAVALPRDSFTQRSRQVLAEYRRRFEPGTGSKRRHPSQGGLAATHLSMDDVVRGKSRSEACRWFYETLVLRNNDFVELEQRQAYGDILIRAKPKMAAAGTDTA